LPIVNGKSARWNRLSVRRKRKPMSECTETESGRQLEAKNSHHRWPGKRGVSQL
jgi:hypothetical protein